MTGFPRLHHICEQAMGNDNSYCLMFTNDLKIIYNLLDVLGMLLPFAHTAFEIEII